MFIKILFDVHYNDHFNGYFVLHNDHYTFFWCLLRWNLMFILKIILYSFWRTLWGHLMFIFFNVNVNFWLLQNVHCTESCRSLWRTSMLDVNVNWRKSWCSSKFFLMFILIFIFNGYFVLHNEHFVLHNEHFTPIWCSSWSPDPKNFIYCTMFVVKSRP